MLKTAIMKYNRAQKRVAEVNNTLKRDPIEENFDDFEDSSGERGNRPATNEHFEAIRRSWCSATT